MSQVITISPVGSILALKAKRGEGLDLRSLGPVEIRRVTMIEFSETYQLWMIRWEDCMGNAIWTVGHLRSLGVSVLLTPTCTTVGNAHYRYVNVDCAHILGRTDTSLEDGVISFLEYEDAVAVEVAVIKQLQLSGKFVR